MVCCIRVALVLAALAGACSDSPQQPGGDGAADGAVDTISGQEAGPDATGDAASDAAVSDAATDGPPADGGGDGGPSGRTCSDAIPITLSGGKGTATGEIKKSDTDNDVQLKASDCTGNPTPGVDRFYSVTLTAGTSYVIAVKGNDKTPAPLFIPAIYVFTDCSSVAKSCVGGSSTKAHLQQVPVKPVKTRTYTIGVDSAWVAGSVGTFGTYTVHVMEARPNDTCAGAAALSWSGSKATVSSDMVGASNTLTLPATGCVGAATAGLDLFYALKAKSGKGYQIKLKSAHDASVYVLSACSGASSSCVTGADEASAGGEESIKFVAKSNGTYLIGVDGKSPTVGTSTFTLTVTEYTPPVNDTCAGAATLVFSGGKASTTGDTSLANNSSTLSYTSCLMKKASGPDLFYAVNATAGAGYKVTLKPGFNGAVYVFTQCGNIEASCLTASDNATGTGDETVSFVASKAGTYYIAVDSAEQGLWPGPVPGPGPGGSSPGSPGSSGGPSPTPKAPSGSFKLLVDQFVPPANSICAKPTRINWSGSKAVASGDTTGASNDIAGVKCNGTQTFDGPQLYYVVALTKGKSYTAKASPTGGFDPALYAFPASTACSAYAVNPACYYTYSAQAGAGAAETVVITPTATGDWIFAVDSTINSGSASAGAFTLTVEEPQKPANDTCATAATLVVPAGGKVTASGHTLGASDSVDLPSSGCTKHSTAGPDRFYKVQLQSTKSYDLKLDAAFNGALYVFTSCGSPAGTCMPGMGSDQVVTGTEWVSITPSSTQTYYIGVDGRSATDAGGFALTIEELSMPPPIP